MFPIFSFSDIAVSVLVVQLQVLSSFCAEYCYLTNISSEGVSFLCVLPENNAKLYAQRTAKNAVFNESKEIEAGFFLRFIIATIIYHFCKSRILLHQIFSILKILFLNICYTFQVYTNIEL